MGKCMKLSKHLGGGKLGRRRYYFRFQQIRIAGTSGGIQPAQSGSWNYEKSANPLLNSMCYILLDFNSKIISCDPTISVSRLLSVVGCFVLFADQWVFWFSLADLSPFGSCNSLLKRCNLCEKHKQLWTSNVHCECFIFVVYGSVFTTYRSQQKSEASRKSRADLEGNNF